MKLLFILIATMCLTFCSDGPKNKSDKGHKNPELTGDNLSPEDEGSGSENKDSGTETKKESPVNSLQIAKIISNFKNIKRDRSVCQFRVDHITGNIFISGSNLITSEGIYQKIPKILKNSPGWNLHDDFKFISRNQFFKGDTLVLPYKYDPVEKYGNWCPKKEVCIVYIVLKGDIHEPRYPDNFYVYNDKLMIMIVFNNQLLDFSTCSKS